MRAFRMIVTEHVQGAMNHEPRNLLAQRTTVCARISSRHIRTYVDVANERCTFMRRQEAKRNYVRGASVAQVILVKLRHRLRIHECDGELRVSHTLRVQHLASQPGHRIPSEWAANGVKRNGNL